MTEHPFAVLLGILDRRGADPLCICHKPPDGPMGYTWTTAADAPSVVARHSGVCDIWFGAQPMRPPEGRGRGKSCDVTGLRVLYADLDYPVDGKPDGPCPETAMDIVEALSVIVGGGPAAIVASGYGVQPYFVLDTDVDVVSGALLLARWRALVLNVAKAHDVRVDSGVFDLARILRVPGPPNLKRSGSARTGLIVPTGAARLSLSAVNLALDAYAPVTESLRAAHADNVARLAGVVPPNGHPGDRVFTDAQAMDFIEEFALSRVRSCPWGAGGDFWKVLWEAGMTCSNFAEMFDEDSLRDMLYQAIRDGHDGTEPDANDCYQVAMGFIKGREWLARRPTEAETLDPFSPHCIITGERWGIPDDVELTTDYVIPSQNAITAGAASPGGAVLDDTRRLRVTFGHEMTMHASTWLWEHSGECWLPLRSLVLLGGREGIGKSTWTARLIAQVTNGKMHGEYLGKPKSVIVAAAEDDWESVILPRLVAAGTNLSRIMRVDAERNGTTFGLTLPTDVPALEKLVIEQDVALIVLDPLLGTVEGRLDTHKDSDVRRALAPLSALAHSTHATVIGLIHQNKTQGGDLLTRMMGSRAFAAVARAVLVCAEAPVEDGDELLDSPRPPRSFLFGQLKNNLGPRVETSVRYEISSVTLGDSDPFGRAIRTSKIKVIAYGEHADVEETVLAKEKSLRDGTDKRRAVGGTVAEKCAAWILATLQVYGAMETKVLKERAAAAGFNESAYKKAAAGMNLIYSGEVRSPVVDLSPADRREPEASRYGD